MKRIHVILTPAELPGLRPGDLDATLCVVFDVLRATSAFVTALWYGAKQIIPVSEITEALAWRQKDPGVLLAGERDGVKIGPPLTGGVQFNLGNSPREFVPEIVRDRIIVSTTTNGTRALRACARAQVVLAGAFLNLAATARFLSQAAPAEILLVCAGTGAGVALEDVLAAGALAGLLGGDYSDSTEVAVRAFQSAKPDLPAVLGTSQNARRLLAIPELRPDVAFCAQRDVSKIVAAMGADGGLGPIAK